MNPRCIIIKSQTKELYYILIYKLKEFKNIRFFYRKINGFYTIVIKCYNYYYPNNQLSESKLYGSYIFLYSIISIILSELFITYHENIISKRIIYTKKLKNIDYKKLSSISALLLDENSPLEFSKILYRKRKNHILNTLFQNFIKRNFVFIDNFIDLFAKDYLYELKSTIDAAIEILHNKSLYSYIMSFIFAHGDIP